jgi:hypothetical protein
MDEEEEGEEGGGGGGGQQPQVQMVRQARHRLRPLRTKRKAMGEANGNGRNGGGLATSGGQLERQSVIFGPGINRGTVTGLKPNSMNYAVITVMNGQNEGSPSQEISFRTKEGGE